MTMKTGDDVTEMVGWLQDAIEHEDDPDQKKGLHRAADMLEALSQSREADRVRARNEGIEMAVTELKERAEFLRGQDDKSVVLGIVERDGEVITRVIPNRHEENVIPHIVMNVKQGTRIATDEAKAFGAISAHGFRHSTVNHSIKEYVRGDTHTNTIEGFWAVVKRTIKGTHVWVSPKYLPLYLREIEYRFNLRRSPSVMFDLLVQAFGSSPRRAG